MRIYYKIKDLIDWFRYDLFYGIENLYLWFRVIWGDRAYDFSYIYLILQQKLKLVEKRIRTNDIHTTAQRDAQQIRICLDLLNHLIKDDYENNLYYFHRKKWGGSKHKFIPLNDGCSRLEITYENAKTSEEQERAGKESHEIFCKVELFRKKCRILLFKLIEKYIVGWWD